MPLRSLVGECHVWWCGLNSPMIILLFMLRSWLKRVVLFWPSMSIAMDIGGKKQLGIWRGKSVSNFVIMVSIRIWFSVMISVKLIE